MNTLVQTPAQAVIAALRPLLGERLPGVVRLTLAGGRVAYRADAPATPG